MGNILRHTGINIGGISSVSWVFREDIISITGNESYLNCSVNLRPGASWNTIYCTPETAQLDSDHQDTVAGLKYVYKLKVLVPKDRRETEAEILRMRNRCLLVKFTDKYGITRLLGTPDNPMKLTYKVIKPATMEGFNSYELLFQGECRKPAWFIPPTNGGIPDDSQF
jgi:hypothetical protein